MGFENEARVASALLDMPHQVFTLVAPWRGGKSWLLSRLLRRLTPSDVVARLDPSGLEQGVRHSAEGLLTSLALALADAVALHEREALAVGTGDHHIRRLYHWMERCVMPRVQGRLVLVVEDLDRIPATSAPPLLGLLTSLVGSQDRPIWDRLRLVLTSALPPMCLPAGGEGAGRALSGVIALDGLDREAVRRLASLHGFEPDDARLDALATLGGGHPYLTRLILAAAARSGLDAGLTPAAVEIACAPARLEFRLRAEGDAIWCDGVGSGRLLVALPGPCNGACGHREQRA